MLAVILAASMLGFTGAGRAATIGLSLPLGGELSGLAAGFLKGAELAMETIGRDLGHELFVVDDGCQAGIGGLAADDLAERGIAIATGYLCNAPATVAAGKFRASGIPLLIAGARSVRLIKDRDREEWNLWRYSPGDDDLVIAAAAALSKRWINTPYAIVDDGTIYGRNLSDLFRLLMEEAGTPPQFVDNFRAALSTQAGLIRRLQGAGVKAVFVAAAASQDVLTIARNLKDFNVPLELAGGENLDILPWLQDAPEVPPGLLMMMPPPAISLESAASLINLLDARGIEPDAIVLEGFAALEIALAALGENPARTTQNLQEMEFETVLGKVAFDAQGKNTVNRFALHVWNGQELVDVEAGVNAPDTQ